jgi:hypothetical protein
MRLDGSLELSRERQVIKVSELEEREIPAWLDDETVGLVADTFFSTQSDIIVENFKTSFVAKMKESFTEVEMDTAPLFGRLEAFLDECCAKHHVGLTTGAATEVLIGLGETRSKELEAFCRSEIAASMRDTIASRSDELKADRIKAGTNLAVDAAAQAQQIVVEWASQE